MLNLNNYLVCFRLLYYAGFDIFCGLMRCGGQRCKSRHRKPTRIKAYSVNILLYGSVWGVYICGRPCRPAKAIFCELQTRFAGRRDAGAARVALISAAPPPSSQAVSHSEKLKKENARSLARICHVAKYSTNITFVRKIYADVFCNMIFVEICYFTSVAKVSVTRPML